MEYRGAFGDNLARSGYILLRVCVRREEETVQPKRVVASVEEVPAQSGRRKSSGDERARALLEVSGLHVSYAGVRALRDVSVTVGEGGIIAVLGNNGAGKSTLLRAISGTLPMH